jgi:hypothetical protein
MFKNYSMKVFGVFAGGVAKGITQGYVQHFYTTCPISNATLVIDALSFPSIYVGAEVIDGIDVYKVIFITNDIRLPLGNTGKQCSVVAAGANDGAVVFYANSDD